MEPNPHYRYVRSLGCNASLFAVTEPGIDEFLAAPEAGCPGVVVIARDGDAGGEPDIRFYGGPRVSGILSRLHEEQADAIAASRPLAVVSIESSPRDLWVGDALARTLRTLATRAASAGGGSPLGRFEELAASLPGAVSHVIGLDPFAAGSALH